MVLSLVLAAALLGLDEPHVAPELLGRFDLAQIPEASGIVRSRRNPDYFWVHNDSGNAPILFAVTRDAQIVRAFSLAVPTLDWEDVAVDDRGRLYVADVGNNGGRLGLRAVYTIEEPDPARPPEGLLRPTSVAWYAMPADDRFDAEGLVVEGSKAILVTKRRDGREAELRELVLDPPSPISRPSSARKIGTLPGFVEPATGADLSPDGLKLAVCGIDVVRVYLRPGPGRWDGLTMSAEARLPGPRQVEGIAWDGVDLLLAGEGGGIERLSEAAWSRGRPAHEGRTGE